MLSHRRRVMPAGLVGGAVLASMLVASQSGLLHGAGSRSVDPAVPALGFTAEPSPRSDRIAHGHAVVTSVADGSLADRNGLEIGDVVMAVNGEPTSDPLHVRIDGPVRRIDVLRHGVARTILLR